MRRRRWRTAVLWIGCTLSGLIVVAFLASGHRRMSLRNFTPAITVHGGAVGIALDGQSLRRWLLMIDRGPFFSDSPSWGSWNEWRAISGRLVVAPRYALFLAVAVPTLLVWRFVPKFPRGHCRRCGYNLTGLAEARCPECGQAF